MFLKSKPIKINRKAYNYKDFTEHPFLMRNARCALEVSKGIASVFD